jgi:hypothetical protein
VSGVALFAAVTLAVAPVHGERLTHTDAVMAIKGEAVQTFYSFTENHLHARGPAATPLTGTRNPARSGSVETVSTPPSVPVSSAGRTA